MFIFQNKSQTYFSGLFSDSFSDSGAEEAGGGCGTLMSSSVALQGAELLLVVTSL